MMTTDVQNHFADRFYQAVGVKGAPVCVGLDPVFERMPIALTGGQSSPSDDQHAAEVFETYCLGLLEAVAPYCPIVKPQLACFERYHAPGFAVYHKMVQAAKSLGIMVLADGKRGDIGTSSAHYAAGLLGAPDGADALTVNPYLGVDGIEPFAKVANEQGKGLFSLVRTSNPGGDALQTQKLADGRSVAEMVAELVADFGANYVGACGYSLLGAVVGATKSKDGAALRAKMPQQIFLVPGYGAQGGTADDVKPLFKQDGTGAIITASRSVIYAYLQQDGEQAADWKAAIASAAKQLRDEIQGILS